MVGRREPSGGGTHGRSDGRFRTDPLRPAGGVFVRLSCRHRRGGAFFPLHPVSSPAEWRWSGARHSCQIWSVGVMSLGRVRGTGPRWLPDPSPRASYLTLPPHVFWRDWFRTLLVGSSFLLPLYLLLSH